MAYRPRGMSYTHGPLSQSSCCKAVAGSYAGANEHRLVRIQDDHDVFRPVRKEVNA